MVVPVFFLFLFGLFEVGHAMMISNLLEGACRNGARFGATEAVTSAMVEATVRKALASTVDADSLVVMIKNATALEDGQGLPETEQAYEDLPDLEVAQAEHRQLFLVRAVVNYNDVALLRLPFLEGVVLTGQSLMRHE